MISWLTSRILQAAGVVLATTIVVFLGINAIGNPVDVLAAPDATPAERLQAAKDFGLDLPLWQQYFTFLERMFQGNLGVSYVFNRPALEIILERLPATIELAVATILLASVIGIPLGLIAGRRPGSLIARALMSASIIGFSLPVFWVGILLIWVFAVLLGWLPSVGRGDTVMILGTRWSVFTVDGLKHLLLPTLSLLFIKISLVIRVTEAAARDIFPMEYIKFARAKGISETRIISIHALKNVLIPVITVIGLEFASLISASIVVESIFSWPGVGKLVIDSIDMLDRPVILAYMVIAVLSFVIVNFVVDVIYAVLDPRVRSGGLADE